MKILAIHPGHNATAGLFEDGRCIEYHHEERFSNLKNHTGFPYQAVGHLLSTHDPKGVTEVVIPHEGFMAHLFTEPTQNVNYEDLPAARAMANLRRAMSLIARPIPSATKLKFRGLLRRKMFLKAEAQLKQILSDRYHLRDARTTFYDHHTCHAITPVYFFGLDHLKEKCLLITADGAGGDSCSKIFLYDPLLGSYEKIAHSFYPASLGYLYALTTQYLGMKPGEHEYKVMGLAAYSSDDKYWRKISERLKDLIQVNTQSLTLESSVDMTEALPALKRIFDEQRFDNIAAAVQDTLEERIIELTRAAIEKTGVPNIALSGGVFMNVKMNQKLIRLPQVSRAFFQPSCGDESLGIGGAASRFIEAKTQLTPVRTMYTGIQYPSSELETFLEKSPNARGLNIEKTENIEKKTADLLANNQIVARFDGRGEWGARSLCNRAILAKASDMRSFYTVNDMVKMRDFWMPFAPTILMDWGPRYVLDWDLVKEKALESSRYMILTVDSTELAQDHLRAAIHQKDKTLRPQMIGQNDNPSMFAILKHFESLTGMGGVMNTSFNLHGYPLVGTPEVALRTFVNSGLRYLAMGCFLISKI